MARAFGQHPADWCGLPETRGAYCWTVWAMQLLHAEYEAQRQVHK